MRKNYRTRLWSLLLCAVMLFALLTGCGGGDSNSADSSGNNGASTNGSTDGSGESGQSEYVYVAEYVPIAGEFSGNFQNMICVDDTLYVSAYEKVADLTPEGETPEYEGQYWVYGTVLYKINLDGSYEKLPYTPAVPESLEETSSTSAEKFLIGEDGSIYLLERNYRSWFDAPEGVTEEDEDYWSYYQYEESYALRILNADGSERELIDLTSLKDQGGDEEYFYVNGFQMDDDGNLYLVSENNVYVLDSAGALQTTLHSDNWISGIVKLNDGSLAISRYGDNGQELCTIDLANKQFGEGITVRGDLYNMSPGGGDYDFYYTNGLNFYGYSVEREERVKLLNWLNCDVDPESSNNTPVVTPDGRVITLATEWNSDYSKANISLIVLTPKPADSVPQKEVITLATQYLDYSVRSQIVKFNKNNDKYRIEVLDYSEYNTDEDYQAGLTKLKTEILSGNVPDLIDTNQLPVSQFAAKGLLEDLYPYIDSDPDLSREDFIPSVLTSMERDGKLYQTLSNFYILTAVGPASVVGDTPGWTVEEFQQALATMPEGCTPFGNTTTQAEILQYCLYLDMDSYVNWSTGEVRFDTPEFVSLLEFVNTFPSDFDWENYDWSTEDSETTRIATGQQMLMSTSIDDFESLQLHAAIFGDQGYTYIGYPTSYGTGNMFISTGGSSCAMSSKCSNKEAAWEFLRQYFTESYQEDGRYSWGFPVNAKAFQKKLEEAMTPQYEKDADGNYLLDENGERILMDQGTWGYNDVEIKVRATSQEEADKLMQLVETTTKSLNFDTSLNEIVSEGVEPYFSGERSAEDVAKQIQSKVSIYVNEQR